MKGFLQLSGLDIVIVISIILVVCRTLVFQFNNPATGVFLTSIRRPRLQMEKQK